MTYLNSLKAALQRWRRDEDGVVTVEFAIIAPILITLIVIFFGAFQGFRKEVVAMRASVTVADALSRELDFVDDDYIDGMASLLNFLTNSADVPGLRVTSLKWELADQDDAESGELRVVWSEARNTSNLALTSNETRLMADRLPTMVADQRIILAETWVSVTPPVELVSGPYVNKTFDFIYPRFASRVCFNNTPLDPDTSLC